MTDIRERLLDALNQLVHDDTNPARVNAVLAELPLTQAKLDGLASGDMVVRKSAKHDMKLMRSAYKRDTFGEGVIVPCDQKEEEHLRQAEQAARADERRKTLEEEAAYHTKEAASWDRVAESLKAKGKEDAMHQAEGWAAYHESQAERLSETALTNESGEPGEAV